MYPILKNSRVRGAENDFFSINLRREKNSRLKNYMPKFYGIAMVKIVSIGYRKNSRS